MKVKSSTSSSIYLYPGGLIFQGIRSISGEENKNNIFIYHSLSKIQNASKLIFKGKYHTKGQ